MYSCCTLLVSVLDPSVSHFLLLVGDARRLRYITLLVVGWCFTLRFTFNPGVEDLDVGVLPESVRLHIC